MKTLNTWLKKLFDDGKITRVGGNFSPKHVALIWGGLAFGFDLRGVYVESDAEQKIEKMIFEYFEGGLSAHGIVVKLLEKFIIKTSGKTYTKKVVMDILCKHKKIIGAEMTYKIGIAGRAGSGKSTFAKMLAEHLDSFAILPFARPLKDIARQMGWNGEERRQRA